MRQIVLDTETTGLDPKHGHRVIEIGAVEMVNRRLTGRRYHEYINPQREVEQEALAVHGITNEFLLDKPVFKEIVEPFFNFIQGAELVIHNAPFDVKFINHELNLAKFKPEKVRDFCQVFDTLVLARKMHPGQRNNLDALCRRYGVDNSNRDLHGALLDAEILSAVYLAMTGGQANLFSDAFSPEKKVEHAEQQLTQPKRQRDLKVQLATEAELQAHEAFLKDKLPDN